MIVYLCVDRHDYEASYHEIFSTRELAQAYCDRQNLLSGDVAMIVTPYTLDSVDVPAGDEYVWQCVRRDSIRRTMCHAEPFRYPETAATNVDRFMHTDNPRDLKNNGLTVEVIAKTARDAVRIAEDLFAPIVERDRL